MKVHRPLTAPVDATEIAEYDQKYAQEITYTKSVHSVLGISLNASKVALSEVSATNWKALQGFAVDVERDPRYPHSSPWSVWESVVHTLETLTVNPDLIFVEGQGINHENRFGLACMVGLVFNKPTIAVSEPDQPQPLHEVRGNVRGSRSDNLSLTEYYVWTQAHVLPIAVSVGHMIDQDEAISRTLWASPVYRMPTPIVGARNLLE